MASLREQLLVKYDSIVNNEENLETGRIWMYTETNVRTKLHTGFCWKAPATGTAVIEVWGAGGSGARMCCCGFGLPGNNGAYSKKTITVQSGCYVCGNIGYSCGNQQDLCFRGCSEPTQVCWFGNGTNGCICAQGGRGGTSICSTTPSGYCCYTANGFCTTKTLNENCGVVCNFGTTTGAAGNALAYGGDINRDGCFNCVSFFGCYPSCVCFYHYHMRIPPGFISDKGAVVSYTLDNDNGAHNWSGNGLGGFVSAVNAATRNPVKGSFYTACWTGNRTCGCYDGYGCIPFMPIGVGGLPPMPCGDVRDGAYRGGHGAVRIKFIAS